MKEAEKLYKRMEIEQQITSKKYEIEDLEKDILVLEEELKKFR